jgi:hypothetical protein
MALPEKPKGIYCSGQKTEGAMKLSKKQRQLLASRDSDGRVFTRKTPEVKELIKEGYLEESVHIATCFYVKKTAGGKNIDR